MQEGAYSIRKGRIDWEGQGGVTNQDFMGKNQTRMAKGPGSKETKTGVQ